MIEYRKESDGTAVVEGTASRYKDWYTVAGKFEERVMPGAGSMTLSSNPDVVFTGQHDRGRAVARTPDTLTLREDATGLHYRAVIDVAHDGDARSLASKIERRVFTESSFGFRVPPGGDTWSDDFTQRTITRYSLDRGDVSAVPFGASPTTDVTVERSMLGSLEERRSLAEAVSTLGYGGTGWVYEPRRAFSEPERERLAKAGIALPDGSYPIPDVAALKDAIQAFGRAKDPAAARAHIIKRARALARTDLLPESWNVGKRAEVTSGDWIGRRGTRRYLARDDSADLMVELLSIGAVQDSHARTASIAHDGDRARSAPHLLDAALVALGHAHRHVERLADRNVQESAASTAFNQGNAMTHVTAAMDHVRRLGKHLEQHPSDPATFKAERTTLTGMRRAS